MKQEKQKIRVNLPKAAKKQLSLQQISYPVQNINEIRRLLARAHENAVVSKTRRSVETEQAD